jgi:hypothetical protein
MCSGCGTTRRTSSTDRGQVQVPLYRVWIKEITYNIYKRYHESEEEHVRSFEMGDHKEVQRKG